MVEMGPLFPWTGGKPLAECRGPGCWSETGCLLDDGNPWQPHISRPALGHVEGPEERALREELEALEREKRDRHEAKQAEARMELMRQKIRHLKKELGIDP